ncbi:hypothetical protein PM8797T_15778 [Gimesia maris DSM 8797]|nr:hypothetical protein PM8797T_15778 [Gimesia maris DSM 8797]
MVFFAEFRNEKWILQQLKCQVQKILDLTPVAICSHQF